MRKYLYFSWVLILSASMLQSCKTDSSTQIQNSSIAADEPDQPRTDDKYSKKWANRRNSIDEPVKGGLELDWLKSDEDNQKALNSFEHNISNALELGPHRVGGRTLQIHFDLANENRIFAASNNGGLWKSENSGDTWLPLSDNGINLSISSITQSPFNTDIIYYSTGNIGSNLPPYVNGLETSKGIGIFKSTDGGNTFFHLEASNTPEIGNISVIKHSLDDPYTLFVGTREGGLFRSTNGGFAFAEVLDEGFGVTDIEVLPPTNSTENCFGGTGHTILVGVGNKGVYMSNDDGENWCERLIDDVSTSDVNEITGRIHISYCENDPSIVYAVGTATADDQNPDYQSIVGVTVFKSSNYGITWEHIEGNNLKDATANYGVDGTGTLFVNPNNPNQILYGEIFMQYSDDGGLSWNLGDGGHLDYFDIRSLSGSNDVYFSNDGGIYRNSWENIIENLGTPNDISNGYNVTEFFHGMYFPTGNAAIGGAQDNGVLCGNSAQNWLKLELGDGTAVGVNQQDPKFIFHNVGPNFKRTNLETSEEVSMSVGHSLLGVNNEIGGQIFALEIATSTLHKSENNGDLWEAINQIPNDGPLTHLYVSKTADPSIYISGSTGQGYIVPQVSSSVNENIIDLRASIPNEINAHWVSSVRPDPQDENTVFVTFVTTSMLPRVYKVENVYNNAPNWTAIHGDLPEGLPCNSIIIDPTNNNRLYLGTDFGLYSTSNGGQNWHKESSIPNVEINELLLRPSDNKLFIVTYGRGIWNADVISPASFAALPYETSFENGSLDQYWSGQSTADHALLEVTTDFPNHDGAYKLAMGTDGYSGYNLNEASLKLDLEDEQNVKLNFWWNNLFEDVHDQDGVFLSVDNGVNFHKIFDFTVSVYGATWRNDELNLSAIANVAGLTLSSNSVIKFSQYDDYPILVKNSFIHTKSDGILLDQIEVSSDGKFAQLPYSTGFEEGCLDPYWRTPLNAQNSGVTHFMNPIEGNYHAFLHSAQNQANTLNVLDLGLNIEYDTDIALSFDWRDVNDESDEEDGVFISDDNGLTFHKIYSLTSELLVVEGFHVDIDLSAQIAELGLQNSPNFILRFQQLGNNAAPDDGILLDNINISARLYADLPYEADFNNGVFDEFWDTQSNSAGGVKILDYPAYLGPQYEKSVIMYTQSLSNPSQNSIELHVNLENQENVYLDFAWSHRFNLDPSENGVFLSVNGGLSYTSIFPFVTSNETAIALNQVSFNLSEYALLTGQSLGSQCVIKFKESEVLNSEEYLYFQNITIDDVRVYGVDFAHNNNSNPISENQSFYGENNLHAYPNPSAGIVNLNLPENAPKENLRVQLHNQIGQLVYSKKFDQVQSRVVQFDISELSQGNYIATVTSNGIPLSSKTTIVKK